VYFAIDQFFVWATFTICASLVKKFGEIFTEDPEWLHKIPLLQQTWFEFVIYASYNAMCWTVLVGCFGRSLGMWVLGLLMVSKAGNRVSFLQVILQTFLLPLNFIFFGWIVGFMRRDGRFVSDIIGGVAIVYAWDARHVSENNPEMAMSLTDFVDTLPEQERVSLILGGTAAAANNDNENGDDGDDNDDIYHSVDEGGDIEIPDVEKGDTR